MLKDLLEEKIELKIENLKKALNWLKDIIVREKNNLTIDAGVQRFEYSVELSWKLIKKILENDGMNCKTPRECIEKGYTTGLINNLDTWKTFLNLRNEAAHMYDDTIGERIFDHLGSLVFEIEKLIYNIGIKFLKNNVLEIISNNINIQNYDLFLFGSRADGTSGEKSDFDIGILGEEKIEEKIIFDINEKLQDLPYIIDFVDFHDKNEEFKKFAIKNIIYWNKRTV